MDPMLIDADDSQRAPQASLRSPDFKRMVSLTWPHRRFIILGMIASVFYGALNSISIIGMLPVLTVMVSDEGLHGWIYRSVAEDRLDAHLSISVRHEGPGPRIESVDVLSIGHHSPLLPATAPLRLLQYDGQPVESFAVLGELARSEKPVTLEVAAFAAPGQAEAARRTLTVTLDKPTFKDRLFFFLARLIPQEQQRSDRVVTLMYALGVVVVLVILSNVARFIAQYFVSVGVLRSVMDLRRTLYRKVLRLPMSFFSESTSDIVSRFVQDTQEIQRGLMALFGKLVREPVKAGFVLAAALILNAQLTVTMLIIVPIVVTIFWAAGRKIRKANKRLLQTYGIMIGALSTALQAVGVVKAYNAENVERKRLWRIDRRMFKHQLRIAWIEAFMNPLLEVLGVIAVAIVTVWLGSQVITGRIKLAEFGTILIALAMLLDPLRKFSDVYPRVMRSAAGARRIFSVADAPEEEELSEGAIDLPPLADRIELKHVTFAYPGRTTPALRDVSVTIHKGEAVALVGPNGSGKTTLTNLIVRFYDPQAGAILFDDLDIRRATLRSLRRQISLVSQDPVVFGMTVAENIAYGSRNHDHQRVADAARRAFADEFISKCPGGYEEMIGERGTTLSGGQRQRLCIARAIMRDAPILIFDEATSQIDSESEERIQDAVRDFAVGRTTIIIAHRLSTIRFAQRVIVMDGGRAIDTGTHDELLARCSLYQNLCRTQLAE